MKQNLYRTKHKIEGVSEHYETSWNIYKNILKIVKPSENDKILDAGCGNGEFSNYLKNYDLYGVDFHNEAIGKAKKKNYKKVVKSEIYKTPFKNKEFDKTFCIQVFQYLEDPKKAFKELIRITEKQMIISVPNFKWLRLSSYFSKKYKMRYEYCIEHENFTDDEFLKKLGKKYNLKIEIKYLSNRFNFVRNLIGNHFSSELIAIYNLQGK